MPFVIALLIFFGLVSGFDAIRQKQESSGVISSTLIAIAVMSVLMHYW